MNQKLRAALTWAFGLFLVIATIYAAMAIEVTLISNTPQCFNCESVYRVCKDTSLTLQQAQTAIKFYDIDIREITREFDFGQYKATNITSLEPAFGWTRKNLSCPGSATIENLSFYCTVTGANGTSTSITPYAGIENGVAYAQEWAQTGINPVTRTKIQYQKFTSLASVANAFKNADIGTCWNVSIRAKLKRGENVDNVICIGDRCFTEWAWWNNSFAYRANVTLNTTVASSLTNFSFGIKIDTASLIAAGKLKGNCADIRVTNSTDIEIPHEIENCNSTYSVVWVRAPYVTNQSLNNTFIVYYGSPNATDNQDPASVWAGYAGVWHGSNLNDSLGINNLIARGDGAITYNQSRCKFGGCLNSEANGYFNTTDTGISTGTGNITFRAWGWKSKAANNYNVVFIQGNPASTQQNQFYWQETNLCIDYWGGGGGCLTAAGALAANINFYVYIGTQSTMYLYLNKSKSSEFASTRNIGSKRLSLMAHETGGNQFGAGAPASIDEVRIDNSVRSDDWLAAEYGAIITLQNETPLCVANWSCDSFAECNSSNISACLSVEDLNNCGGDFEGSLSDYNVACIWNVPPTWKQYPPNITTSVTGYSETLNFTDIEGDAENFTINGTFAGELQFEKLILRANFTTSIFRYLEVNVSDDNGTVTGLFWVNYTCLPVFSCLSYGTCINATQSCLNVTDALCGETFAGNLTDYNVNCTTTPAVSSNLIGFTLNSTNNILIFGILVFLWLGVAFLAAKFKNPAFKGFDFILGIILGMMSLGISIIMTLCFIFFSIILFML